jgi:hypothetical protein
MLTTVKAGMNVAAVQARWTPQADAVMYRMGSSLVGHWVNVSPGAFDAMGMLELPDLSTIPGWDPTLAVIPLTQYWYVFMNTGADIVEHLRPLPSHEEELQRSGWRLVL